MKGLRKIINKNADHWNKELETTKRNQSKLDKIVAKIEIGLGAMNSRLIQKNKEMIWKTE